MALLGILSDAHGNGPAFQQAVSLLRAQGAEQFAFLGDAVGYLPSASVVQSLRTLEGLTLCLRGNHEIMMLTGNGDAKREAVYQHGHVRKQLSAEELAFIETWAIHQEVVFPAGKALFVHGSPNDPSFGYLYPDTDLASQQTDADFVFMGHSHFPFIRTQGKTHFINVGSCGLPRDDGRYGAAALFDTQTGAARILRFNIHSATQAALAACRPVHPSVDDVYARQRDTIEGELHAN